MTNKKPQWTQTDVPWEIKKVIWLRWSLGDNVSAILRFLDLHRDKYSEAPQSRDTITRVKNELMKLPLGQILILIKEMPEIASFVQEKRPDLKKDLEAHGGMVQTTHQDSLTTAHTNWIDNYMAEHGDLPIIPDWLVPLVEGYSAGDRISKTMKSKLTFPGVQTWTNLLPSQKEDLLQLWEWLGGDRRDYLEQLKRLHPHWSSPPAKYPPAYQRGPSTGRFYPYK
jgi:hypothetical protein